VQKHIREGLDEQVFIKQNNRIAAYLESKVPHLTFVGPAAKVDDEFSI